MKRGLIVAMTGASLALLLAALGGAISNIWGPWHMGRDFSGGAVMRAAGGAGAGMPAGRYATTWACKWGVGPWGSWAIQWSSCEEGPTTKVIGTTWEVARGRLPVLGPFMSHGRSFLGLGYASDESWIAFTSGAVLFGSTTKRWQVTVPLWAALGIFSILPAWALWRRMKRLAAGMCAGCGYDLRMHQAGERCPECGKTILSKPDDIRMR